MAISLTLIPYDPLIEDYNYDLKFPFTFGEMTEEYYYNTSYHTAWTEENVKKYFYNMGYFYDNLIVKPTNILSTLTGNNTPISFGVPASEFISGTGNYYQAPTTKFKVATEIDFPDEIYVEVIERLFIGSTSGDGKGVVRYSITVNFSTTNSAYNSPFNLPLDFTQITITKPLTYGDFISFSTPGGIGSWLARNGYVYGVNAYPKYSIQVQESLNSTGCLIQGFKIYKDNPDSELRFMASPSGNYGYNGTVVKPNLNDIPNKWVPYILDLGYDPSFPESEGDLNIGNYDTGSSIGDIPRAPEQSAIRSGMIRMYQMSTDQLNSFANFLWNDSLTEWNSLLNNLKQWFSNPLDSIISLTISPIDIFYDYGKGENATPEASDIKLGGFNTGVQGYLCGDNYKQISLGRLSLAPFYGSYLDCNPHTSFSIYLPYIGFQDIDSDVLFSKGNTSIEVVYTIDILTGVCVASILIEKESNGTHLRHVIYSFAGNTNTTIPITSANMKDFISASIGAIASGVAIASTGGAATPLVIGSMATQSALNVTSQKVNVAHSGGMSLEAGMFGIQYAYLIATRPREARPSNYKDINGIPAETGSMLSHYIGFTQVSTVHVNITGATEEEKQEIETLLKEGIIL